MRPEPFKQVSAEEAVELLQNRVTPVDVRQEYEYVGDHIENAKLIPISDPYEFALDLQEQQPDKNQPLLFICEVGQRSATASLVAAIAGYSQVYNLDGGMSMWRYEGLPVVRGK
jgi:rhodanese-related sulfurtransferase